MKLDKIIFTGLLALSCVFAHLLYINQTEIKQEYKKSVKKSSYKPHKKNYFGVPPLKRNPKYYLVDNNNNQLTDTYFDSYIPASPERLYVRKNNKTGLIDYDGNYILPAEYFTIMYNVHHKTFIARNDDETIVFDKDGKELFKAPSITVQGIYYIKRESKQGSSYSIYDKNFNKLVSIMSTKEPRIVKGEYVEIYNFKRFSLLDFEGQTIISERHGDLSFFLNKNEKDYFTIKYKGKTGIVDSYGKTIIPTSFEEIRYIEQENIPTGFYAKHILSDKENESWAIIDLKGNFIKNPEKNISIQNKDIELSKSQTRFIVKDGKKETIDLMPQKLYDLLVANDVKEVEFTQEDEKNKVTFEDDILKEKQRIEFEKLQNQSLHKTNYKSDFLQAKQNGNYTKLIFNPRVENQFGRLSPNGLSAKYSGKENYYITNKTAESGKYYFEYQIKNTKNKEFLSNNSKFALIHLPSYKTQEGKEKYGHIFNIDADTRISNELKNNSIIGIAIDLDNGSIYYSINGKWKSNPYDIKRGTKISNKRKYHIGLSVAGYDEILTVNFGNLPFKYKKPEGYKAFNK